MLKNGTNPKEASNWITTRLLGYINKNFVSINDVYLTPSMLSDIIEMVDKNEISSKQAKDVFAKVLELNKTPRDVVDQFGMKQNSMMMK